MQQQQPQPQSQQSGQMGPSPPLPFSPSTVTTEQIQKYLDENNNLIMAILENQSLGKLAECSRFQAILQRNLMYLAAIADAQSPKTSTAPSQPPPSSGAQQGNYLQHSQAPTLLQQHGVPVGKLPFQLNALRPQDQQHQLLHLQSQQQFQGQAGAVSALHQAMQPGYSSLGIMGVGREGKQSSLEANSGEGQGK